MYLVYMLCFGRTSVYLCATFCGTSQHCRTFIHSSELWNDLTDSVFDGMGPQVLRAEPMLSAKATRSLFVFYCFPVLFWFSIGWYCGALVFGMIGCKSLSPSLALQTFSTVILILFNPTENACYHLVRQN